MARILYGIHGTGHGHAMRGLTIARALPQHDFLFVANDDAPKVLEPEFRVERLPNLGTVFKNYKVDLGATIGRAIPTLLHRKEYINKALDLIDIFKPDVCMTDLEYFVPRAAEKAGLPCLTLDHQHIITCCKHDLPADMLVDTFVQGLTPRWLFRPTAANLIISFYAPPLLPRYNARIAPPILRDKVIALNPHDEGHIVVYQSNSTDKRLIDFLRTATSRKAYVFGYGNATGQSGNVVFCRREEDEFLRLLEGCAYVIQGGSHTLMGEALYLRKPILSIPLRAMVEQRFNALYLERMGLGRQAAMGQLNRKFLAEFEEQMPQYAANAAQLRLPGNHEIFGLVNSFIQNGALSLEKTPA